MKKTCEQPLVSVIMPVYNQKISFLDSSIRSILNQNYKQFELIIVDDGSSEKCCHEYLKKCSQNDPRIKLIRNKINLGPSASRNRAILESQGKYIAIMDSDDIAKLYRLKKQVNFLEENCDISACGGWAELIDKCGRIIGYQKLRIDAAEIRKNILWSNQFVNSTMMFRKKILVKIGPTVYKNECAPAEDYDLALKLISNYNLCNLPAVICSYRINPNGLSSNFQLMEKKAFGARLYAVKYYGYRYNYILPLMKSAILSVVPTQLLRILFKYYIKTARRKK